MQRNSRFALTLAAAISLAASAAAQFDSALVDFEGPPIDDPGTSQEMFRIPQTSGTTAAYIVANPTPPPTVYTNNFAYRTSGRQTAGVAGLYVKWNWVAPADLNSWCRLTTIDAPVRGNPALHLGGKVRFKLINESELFLGRIGICLGIRETGQDVPQLSNGGTSGAIEWIGVDTADSVILAGTNTTLDSTASGDDVVQAVAGGGSAIIAGPDGVLDSTAAGDDVVDQGFTYAANGERVPIPALELNTNPAPYVLEWDIATGVVSLGGVPQGGGITGFTGDGTLTAANNRGVLEHIAIVNAETGGGFLGEVEFSIDELQFEAPVVDPAVPPTVVSPIIAGATSVTVTGVQFGADRVALLRNHAEVDFQLVSTTDPVVFDISADDANTGEVITATQRVAGGGTSAESAGVTVVAEAPPFGMCVVLDEDADTCDGTEFEFLGATSKTVVGADQIPNGTAIFRDSSQWQSVTWSLSDPNIVTSFLGGDGDIDPSPNGNYALDSLWFNVLPGAPLGPHEVFVDAIQILDASDGVLMTLFNFDDSVTFMTQARGQSSIETGFTSALSALANYDGRGCHRIAWSFTASTDQSLGLQMRVGSSCTTARSFPTANAAKVRMHILARGTRLNPTVALPVIPLVNDLPPTVGDTLVTVTNDATATAVSLYVNGVQVGPAVTPTGTTTVLPTPALIQGQSVSAKQVVGGLESDFANARAVVPQLPPGGPVIVVPAEDGDLAVGVRSLTFGTDMVEIVDNTSAVIGSTTTINPDGTATVPLSRALVHLETITARASNEAGSTNGAVAVQVGIGNGDVYVCIGVREIVGSSAPCSLGTTGPGTGQIEWIGATAAPGGAPTGTPISPSNGWQTLEFDPLTDPIRSALGVGDNFLTAACGSIEHLAVAVNSAAAGRSTGEYEIYVDNVINVGAAPGGVDFVIDDFESYGVGIEALFQEPNFSGSTSGNLITPPNVSAVSDVEGNPGKSAVLRFFFRDTAGTRWVRLTTSGATNRSRPIVDLTKPIRLDILLKPAATCPGPLGDANCDTAVDFFDIDPFLLALFDLNGPTGYLATYCGGSICAVDVDCSTAVDFFDIDPFLVCLFGGCAPCP